jgi:hypothetical protein
MTDWFVQLPHSSERYYTQQVATVEQFQPGLRFSRRHVVFLAPAQVRLFALLDIKTIVSLITNF